MTARRNPRRVFLATLFGLSAFGMLALVLLPIGWQINRFIVWLFYAGRGIGVPDFVTLEWYDLFLNGLLFAVPVCLAALLWPRVGWWMWPVAALALSLLIELVQELFLPREFSLGDIAANTVGSLLGAGAAVLTRRLQTSSDSPDSPPPK